MNPSPLPAEFYDRDPRIVARELLGCLLWVAGIDREEPRIGGRIVETEAYCFTDDPACHAAKGKTRRNASMFGPPGHAYVYAIHSRWCFNLVTEREGIGSAVLLRAIEPLAGWKTISARRGRNHPRELTTGPARLCHALGIDQHLDGWNVTLGEKLWVEPGQSLSDELVAITPRIGVTSGHNLLYRYAEKQNSFVSGPSRLRT